MAFGLSQRVQSAIFAIFFREGARKLGIRVWRAVAHEGGAPASGQKSLESGLMAAV